jgi:hypothetical protein
MLADIARVFVLLGPKAHSSEDEWVLQVVNEIGETAALPEPKVFRADTRPFVEVGEGSRKVNVLRAQDAGAIYRSAHSSAVLVITSKTVRFLLDPRKDPANPRTVCLPGSALRHKALVLTASDPQSLRADLASISSPHPCGIEGLRDPRILPLHLFDRPDESSRLESSAGRVQFIAEYRRGRAWLGPRADWQDASPQARHGIDRHSAASFVSGWQVPSGHHWDVQSARGTDLIGFDSVWHLSREGYMNVFPNGKLNGGRRSRRVWPA